MSEAISPAACAALFTEARMLKSRNISAVSKAMRKP